MLNVALSDSSSPPVPSWPGATLPGVDITDSRALRAEVHSGKARARATRCRETTEARLARSNDCLLRGQECLALAQTILAEVAAARVDEPGAPPAGPDMG